MIAPVIGVVFWVGSSSFCGNCKYDSCFYRFSLDYRAKFHSSPLVCAGYEILFQEVLASPANASRATRDLILLARKLAIA
jgi:hypothetical protein